MFRIFWISGEERVFLWVEILISLFFIFVGTDVQLYIRENGLICSDGLSHVLAMERSDAY